MWFRVGDHFICLHVPQPRAWHFRTQCIFVEGSCRVGRGSNWGRKTDSKKDSTRALVRVGGLEANWGECVSKVSKQTMLYQSGPKSQRGE